MYAWMLPGFITHVGLVYTLSSLETVWYLVCVMQSIFLVSFVWSEVRLRYKLISFLLTSYMLTVPYGGKLCRVQTLAKWQGKHHWRNKLWQIDNKSLIKCILKQFKGTSVPNLSIRARVCTYL